ncbi:MAG: YHS domain-containing (seleno)protein [Planctomycetota bacterium]
MNKILCTSVILAGLTIGYGTVATAEPTTQPAAESTEAVNTDKTGVAINGYDPVAYSEMGEPKKGNFQIASTHDGATYWFVSEKHKALFDADPEKYLPQYGGYCAYGVAIGRKFNADPHTWAIIDGKLYLNLNDQIAEVFN